MKRLMRFLLGLTVGAAAGMLLAPKSGRELRQQLIGGASGKLLPAAPDEFPQPEAERAWDTGGIATAVAEPERVVEETIAEELVVEEIAVAEVAVDEPGVEEVIAVAETVSISDDGVVTDTVTTVDTTTWAASEVEAPAAEPVVAEVAVPAVAEVAVPAAEEVVGEDLRPRIEETRAAVESDIARPFADGESSVDEPVLEGPVYQAPAPEPEAVTVVEEEPPESAAPVPAPHGWDIPYEPDTPEATEEIAAEEPPAELEAEATSTGGVIEEAAPRPVSSLFPPTAATAQPVPQPVVQPVAQPVAQPEPVVESDPLVGPAPVVEEAPAEEAPAASREGSGNIDQAEMRQRIEETRARLKAKAFDAMMSGEAALLSRDSGEKPVPTADDIKLDNDVETTIEESLSQEDS